MRIKAAVAIAAFMLLSGCYADQQQALGKCMLQATNKYPSDDWSVAGRKQGYTTLCMQAEGYDLKRWQNGCPEHFRISDGPTIASCYAPFGTVSAWLTKLQIAADL
jgi:hypothetical protein